MTEKRLPTSAVLLSALTMIVFGVAVGISALMPHEDDAQLNRMHETERNYTYDHLESVTVDIDGEGRTLSEAYAYTAKVGCVNHDGSPVALREIDADGRTLPAMSQPQILDFVRTRLAPEVDLDDFIRAHIDDDTVRQERTAALSEDALFLEFPRTVLGDF